MEKNKNYEKSIELAKEDGFIGSETTAIACLEEGRNFIGSEISKEYCTIANKRINNYKIQLKLFL